MTELSVEYRRLALLGQIIRVVDAGEAHATPGMLMVDPGDDRERAFVSSDARALRDRGLVSLDERYAGGWAVRPTADGRDAWSKFNTRRFDVVERQRAARNDYLRWIYDHAHGGSHAVADHFLTADVSFMGDPYVLEDLKRAGKWLADRNFIEGPGADQRPDPLRVRLTPKGEDWIEARRDVHAEATPAASTNYTFHAPAQVAHNSPNVVQMQANEAKDGALSLAAMLEQLSSTVDVEGAARLGELAAELRDEAGGGARPSRFREIGDAAAKAFAGGLGGALGPVMLAQVVAWLGSLG